MKRLWRATLSSIDGLRFAARHEAAFRQELFLLAAGVPLSFVIAADALTRSLLIASLLLLLLAELINTAFEKLSDHVTPEHNLAIKAVKDLGSAAVMVALAIAGLLWATAAIDWLWR
jgi:diacylglycerol kinase (ATP)